MHCVQATCSPLQEFLHSQSDCRILPRDVIPPMLLGAASSSVWFGLSGSPIIDGPELAHIQRLFRMILGVAGGRLNLLSGPKAFKPSREKEGL